MKTQLDRKLFASPAKSRPSPAAGPRFFESAMAGHEQIRRILRPSSATSRTGADVMRAPVAPSRPGRPTRTAPARDAFAQLLLGLDDHTRVQLRSVDAGDGDLVAAARRGVGAGHGEIALTSPGDASETEADVVAERVMRSGAPQSTLDQGDHGRSSTPAAIGDALGASGRPLEPAVRSFMEPRFGRDFSDVRIHDDARAARSAQAIGARAFTVGRHIVFAEGQYDAHGARGQNLIAHELTHTIQQADRGPAVALAPDPDVQRRVAALARTAIEELDEDGSSKVLLAAILAAARLSAQKEFVAILRAAKHDTYGDYFVFLMTRIQSELGSRVAVGILQMYADANVDISRLNYDLDPLAAVAKFKSLASRYRDALDNGEVTPEESTRVSSALNDAVSALRAIEHPRQTPQVKLAGGAAIAAGWAWRAAAGLAADDVTGIGVADDVAIPFVVVAAVVLSAVALFSSNRPEILDYRPAMRPVQAALAMMAAIVGTATILMAENVADTGIMEEVYSAISAAVAAGAALTICEALARLMAEARRSGDTQRMQRIKKTQKAKGCRHSRYS
ncbi:MAG TPA: DUF4157 domain-containing protein [Kofleriaceae bacterium]